MLTLDEAMAYIREHNCTITVERTKLLHDTLWQCRVTEVRGSNVYSRTEYGLLHWSRSALIRSCVTAHMHFIDADSASQCPSEGGLPVQ